MKGLSFWLGTCICFFHYLLEWFKFKGSFTLERSRAERSKNYNEATVVSTKLQRCKALKCFTEQ